MSRPKTPKEWLRTMTDADAVSQGQIINILANHLSDQQIREAFDNSVFMEDIPE